MRTTLRIACLGILVSSIDGGWLHAQAPAPTPAPTGFEVASVKPSNPSATGPFGSFPMVLPQGSGRLTASNIPLRLLVRMAYGVQDFQIVGGPSWQTSSKFDITAKAADGTTTAPTDMLPLLKGLLADRFKLKTHTETRELPIYVLLLSRSDGTLGPDMKPSTSDCSTTSPEVQKRAEALAKNGIAGLAAIMPKPGETVKCAMVPAINPGNLAAGFGLRADGQPLTMLTQMLTQATGRTVIDKTGLTGLYDWEIRFDPQVFMQMASQMGLNIPAGLGGANSPFADSPSLLTALQEQLGLKLDSQKGPVEVLVIDSAELPEPD